MGCCCYSDRRQRKGAGPPGLSCAHIKDRKDGTLEIQHIPDSGWLRWGSNCFPASEHLQLRCDAAA